MNAWLVILLVSLASAARADVDPPDFIETVHTQSAELAQQMVIDGNQVVWSPYSVANVMPLVNGDVSLQESFKKSLVYLEEIEGVRVKRLSAVYYSENATASFTPEVAQNYAVKIVPSVPEGSQLSQHLADFYKTSLKSEAPEGFIPADFEGVDQVYLTSLLLRGVWETPFRYAPKGRFYLNETNAVKTKYMTNIGFFKYGQIEGVDAKLLALPLKNTTTTYFLFVLPNNYSGLPEVSEQFGKVKVGGLIQSLKTARTQLVVPKLDIDSQLVLQPKPSVKILQSGSIRLSHAGFDNRVSKLKRISYKHLRTRVNKKDIRFYVDHPFIFMVYDTEIGVLNYGEVLLPTTESVLPIRFKTENEDTKLSQNGKNFVEYYNDLGANLYQHIRNSREGSFAISPVSLAHLLASYAVGASQNVREHLFSTLNSRDGILEAFNNIQYFNGTSSNSSTIVGNGDNRFQEQVAALGTNLVESNEAERTQGIYYYSFQTRLRSTKRFRKTFFLNERDAINSTFYEYIGRIKYVSLPYWDARAIQVFVSPTQSLLIFSPNEKSGLHVVEEGLKDFSVTKLLCQMSERLVRLRLPAFEVHYVSEVYPELREVLGGDQLKFEGLGDAVLDGVTQDVLVSVKGSEDAKNKVRVSKYRTKKPNTRINLDRPFVFYLVDNTVGTLAIGRITSVPSLEAPSQPESVAPVPPEVTEAGSVTVAAVDVAESVPSSEQPVSAAVVETDGVVDPSGPAPEATAAVTL